MRKTIAGLLLLIAVCASRALAEPASRELATGGLAVIANRPIELRGLALFVSLQEIRIEYRFFNTSAEPFTTRAAVPMPEIRFGRGEAEPAVPTQNPDNVLDLVVSADGRALATTIEQRAFAGGVDNAEYLGGLGLPLAPHLPTTNEALDRLPREHWPELVALGLADVVQYDDGQGTRPHLESRWALQTILWFDDIFPSRAEHVVQLRYKPSVGVTVETELGAAGATEQAWFKSYEDRYCVDNDLVVSLERRRGLAKNVAGAPFSEARIDLSKSLADWAGPVKDVRVVLDKAEPNNLISVCADGINKIAPTQFAFRIDGGLRKDLDILILCRLPPTR